LKNLSCPFLKKSFLTRIVILLLFISPLSIRAAGSDMSEEVLLTFRYSGVGNVYVTALYERGNMFLPVAELFSLLQVYYESSPGDFSISGTFLRSDQPYHIYFNRQQVVLGREVFTYPADEFRIGELDYYLSPKIFEEVFGLFFTINLNNLVLSLEANFRLPVEERAERERARQLTEAREVSREYYPMAYDRQRRIFGTGFADYSVTGNYSSTNPNMNYSLTGGLELLGGDVQGNLTGAYNGEEHRVRTSNLRWRYVVRDTPWFSAFTAGQLNTTGLQPINIRGAAITNDPIEPRRIYESYIIDGITEPDSEVELYLNNRLIDFQRADAAGYYRFAFPLTYGTSRLTLNIYTPTGEIRTIDRQLQIPFTFLPRGEVSYQLQGGVTENPISGTAGEERVMHGNMAVGVTEWLTAKAGVDYLENQNDNRPFYYGGLSARLFSQYLLNLDLAPEAFYRATASVIYASSRSFNLAYTEYAGTSLYNTRAAEREVNGMFFSPFQLFGLQMGFRVGGEHLVFPSGSITRYRSDLSMRLGRMNVRLNYRDILFYQDAGFSAGQGQLDGSITYTFMRSPGIPVFARGMFMRGNLTYNTANRRIDMFDIQLSRTIRQTGRINLSAGYDLNSRQHFIQAGFALDLNRVRTSTNVDIRGDQAYVRQNVRGSVGFDHKPDRVTFHNRDNVGRAAASVILFIDKNNSGQYDPGDEIIPYRAVRLDRSALTEVGSDGILRITQLQSYFRYNLEVNRAALPNPLLVPAQDKFSFVADPNRYKRIEIPFYQSGIIDGRVVMLRDGQERGQGGLRLLLNGISNDHQEIIRNFSDGSYYAMDIPPGRYTIEVDPAQQQFLGAYQQGGPYKFELQALADGDFIEDLNIILLPLDKEETPAEKPPDTKTEISMVEQAKEEVVVVQKEGISETEEELITTPSEVAAASETLYYVQLGLYINYREAENARMAARSGTMGNFYIRTLDEPGLYILCSAPMKRQEADQLLINLHPQQGFDHAFVRKHPPEWEADSFYISLGSFFRSQSAETYRQALAATLPFDLHVEYNSDQGTYIVRSPDYPAFEEVLRMALPLYERTDLSPVISFPPRKN
jgi:hypothetical protein